MGAIVRWLLPYLQVTGRTNRQSFWVTSVLNYLAFLVAMLAAMGLPIVGLVIAVPVFFLALWVGFAVAVRRLHDRNKSGWWLVIIYAPVFMLTVLGAVVSASDPETGSGLNALGLPFSIWAFVELGCLKGTSGPNRFGDDPLRASPAEVFS